MGTSTSRKGSPKGASALLLALSFVLGAGLLCMLLLVIEVAPGIFGPLGQPVPSPLHASPFVVCCLLCIAVGGLMGGILWIPCIFRRCDHS